MGELRQVAIEYLWRYLLIEAIARDDNEINAIMTVTKRQLSAAATKALKNFERNLAQPSPVDQPSPVELSEIFRQSRRRLSEPDLARQPTEGERFGRA